MSHFFFVLCVWEENSVLNYRSGCLPFLKKGDFENVTDKNHVPAPRENLS